MQNELLCISELRVATGPRVKLAGRKSALKPPVVYSTDRSKTVIPVLVLLFDLCVLFYEAICFKSCLVLFRSCIFSPFSIAITSFWGKRELILELFVRLFDLRLFGFVCSLFLFVSGMGCAL